MDLFKDIISSINTKSHYLMDNNEEAEKAYVPFIVNKAVSYDNDCILYANEMNKCHNLSNKLQYDFYFFALPAKKRFNKWIKLPHQENIELIQRVYSCNPSRAREYLNILEPSQIKEMRTRLGYEE